MPEGVLIDSGLGEYVLPLNMGNHMNMPLENAATNEVVVPVTAENLEVGTQTVETSRVQLHKKVHRKRTVVDPPLQRQRIEIDRVRKNQYIDGPVPIRHEGDTMIVPLLAEVLVVEKKLILKEELHIKRCIETYHAPQAAEVQEEEVTVQRVPVNQVIPDGERERVHIREVMEQPAAKSEWRELADAFMDGVVAPIRKLAGRLRRGVAEVATAQNDAFIYSLKDAPGGTLSEMRGNAETTAASHTKSAKAWALGGLAAVIGGAAISFTGAFGAYGAPVAMGLVLGGFVANSFVSAVHSNKASAAQRFSEQLTGWETLLNTQNPAPAPAPAPEQSQSPPGPWMPNPHDVPAAKA